MNIKTNLLEEYVNFVDNTKKQNKYFKIFIILIVIIMFLFLFKYLTYKYKKHPLLHNIKYINEQQFFSTTNTKNE